MDDDPLAEIQRRARRRAARRMVFAVVTIGPGMLVALPIAALIGSIWYGLGAGVALSLGIAILLEKRRAAVDDEE